MRSLRLPKNSCRVGLAALAALAWAAPAGAVEQTGPWSEQASEEPVEIGLTGHSMVKNERRRVADGGVAVARNGTVPIGQLSVSDGDASTRVLGLRDLSVQAQIEGLIARTTVKHVFANETDKLLEGVFTFRLPDDVAVDRFAMTIQSEHDLMEASLVDHATATRTYTTLVYGMNVDPGVLEWLDGNTFRATVFPIPAKGTKTIVISYLQQLEQTAGAGGRTFYRFPLRGEAAEKLPAANVYLDARIRGLAANPRVGATLDAKIFRTGDGSVLVCPKIAADTEPKEDFVVEIGNEARPGDDAVALTIQAHRADEKKPGAFAVTLAPGAVDRQAAEALDAIFLVDTSGSRTPEELAIARAALKAALEALRENDRFAVVSFDLQPRAENAKLKTPTAANIAGALEELERIKPLGATDIGAALAAVRNAFEKDVRAGARLILVGDAVASSGQLDPKTLRMEVERTEGVLHAEAFALYPGMGLRGEEPRSDQAAIRALGDLLGGPVLRLDGLVPPDVTGRRLAAMLRGPVLRDARLTIRPAEEKAGEGTDVAPELYANIAGGMPMDASTTLYGSYEQPGDFRVRLRGTFDGEAYERTWLVKLPALEPANRAVAKLAARSRIGELQGEGRGTEAVALAKETGVLSRGTAFLVLESEEMYRRFNIERDGIRPGADLAQRNVRMKFLSGTPQPAAGRRLAAADAQGAARDPRFPSMEGNSQALDAAVEIGGVGVKANLHRVTLVGLVAEHNRKLVPHEYAERRQGLTRQIAELRGLPFEPEVIFPNLWLNAMQSNTPGTGAQLESWFGAKADPELWKVVGQQPDKVPESWRALPGFSMQPAREAHVDALMRVEPTQVLVAPDGSAVQVASNQLVLHLAGAIMNGVWPRAVKNDSASEIMRAIKTRRTERFALAGTPNDRARQLWVLLAEVALAEGRHKDAADMARRAVDMAPEAPDVADPLPRLLAALAEHLRGRFPEAADAYRLMLNGTKPIQGESRDMVYQSLLETMKLAGDRVGAIAVIEAWYVEELGKERFSDELGRGYLAVGRRVEAMRAFSTVAEFAPALSSLYATPESWLKRAKLQASKNK